MPFMRAPNCATGPHWRPFIVSGVWEAINHEQKDAAEVATARSAQTICHRAANGDQGVTTAAVQPATGAAAPTGHAACNSAGDGLLRQVGCPKPLALTGCPPTVAMS